MIVLSDCSLKEDEMDEIQEMIERTVVVRATNIIVFCLIVSCLRLGMRGATTIASRVRGIALFGTCSIAALYTGTK